MDWTGVLTIIADHCFIVHRTSPITFFSENSNTSSLGNVPTNRMTDLLWKATYYTGQTAFMLFGKATQVLKEMYTCIAVN